MGVNIKADDAKKVIENRVSNLPRGIVPFTSGCLIFTYAWFWPEGYGRWLGSIVHAFRAVNGW